MLQVVCPLNFRIFFMAGHGRDVPGTHSSRLHVAYPLNSSIFMLALVNSWVELDPKVRVPLLLIYFVLFWYPKDVGRLFTGTLEGYTWGQGQVTF